MNLAITVDDTPNILIEGDNVVIHDNEKFVLNTMNPVVAKMLNGIIEQNCEQKKKIAELEEDIKLLVEFLWNNLGEQLGIHH